MGGQCWKPFWSMDDGRGPPDPTLASLPHRSGVPETQGFSKVFALHSVGGWGNNSGVLEGPGLFTSGGNTCLGAHTWRQHFPGAFLVPDVFPAAGDDLAWMRWSPSFNLVQATARRGPEAAPEGRSTTPACGS
jgi:hypothetical protein